MSADKFAFNCYDCNILNFEFEDFASRKLRIL